MSEKGFEGMWRERYAREAAITSSSPIDGFVPADLSWEIHSFKQTRIWRIISLIPLPNFSPSPIKAANGFQNWDECFPKIEELLIIILAIKSRMLMCVSALKKKQTR